MRWSDMDMYMDGRDVSALQRTRSTARSTSRQRRKRPAASARRVASVVGLRKRPVRRAVMEVGRKAERWDEEARRAWSCGDGLGFKGVDGGSRMIGICVLRDSTRVFSTDERAAGET